MSIWIAVAHEAKIPVVNAENDLAFYNAAPSFAKYDLFSFILYRVNALFAKRPLVWRSDPVQVQLPKARSENVTVVLLERLGGAPQ